jgi:hypothetical protein
MERQKTNLLTALAVERMISSWCCLISDSALMRSTTITDVDPDVVSADIRISAVYFPSVWGSPVQQTTSFPQRRSENEGKKLTPHKLYNRPPRNRRHFTSTDINLRLRLSNSSPDIDLWSSQRKTSESDKKLEMHFNIYN